MNIKKADRNYINQETQDFMGLEFEFSPNKLGNIKKVKDSTKVELIYQPELNKWLDAAFQTAFYTWHNGYEIDINKIKDKTQKIKDYMKQRPVSAILESAIFMFKIDNIPRALTHQIVRHRGMSFNQQSYRVAPCHHADFRIADDINDPEHLSLIKHWLKTTQNLYVKLINDGVPIEQARNVMPMGTTTNIVMTTNLKDLINYIKARTLNITQDEHTYLVMLICKALKEKAPFFYQHFIYSDDIKFMMLKYGVE